MELYGSLIHLCLLGGSIKLLKKCHISFDQYIQLSISHIHRYGKEAANVSARIGFIFKLFLNPPNEANGA